MSDICNNPYCHLSEIGPEAHSFYLFPAIFLVTFFAFMMFSFTHFNKTFSTYISKYEIIPLCKYLKHHTAYESIVITNDKF